MSSEEEKRETWHEVGQQVECCQPYSMASIVMLTKDSIVKLYFLLKLCFFDKILSVLIAKWRTVTEKQRIKVF